MPNSFGKLFTITTWGESHGPGIGVVIDGCPPNLPITAAEIQIELDRRRPGQSDIVTPRKEADAVEILSGIHEGRTTGTPIALFVRNTDARPAAYDEMKDKFRPSHADYTYQAKYGLRDPRGGGRSSARETIGRVAAGAIAAKILARQGVELRAFITRIHDIAIPAEALAAMGLPALAEVEATPVRCPHPATASAMIERIKSVRSQGDSVGGVIQCRVRGLPPDGPLTSAIASDAELPIPMPVLTADGVVFTWNAYEIGPFSDGAYRAALPAEAVRGLLARDPWRTP